MTPFHTKSKNVLALDYITHRILKRFPKLSEARKAIDCSSDILFKNSLEVRVVNIIIQLYSFLCCWWIEGENIWKFSFFLIVHMVSVQKVLPHKKVIHIWGS